MTVRGTATRGLLFVVAVASMVAGSLSGFVGAGSRAYAQEPAFMLYGTVTSGRAGEDDGPLPTRVRATIDGVACGSGEVFPTAEGEGFYVLTVVSADRKPGCGVDGALVKLSLQSGAMTSEDVSALAVFWSGASMRLDVTTRSLARTGAFVGTLPDGPGQALLRWVGPSGTPVEQAIATVDRAVVSVSFWDVSRQTFREYVVGGAASTQTYTLVDADDVVLVRVQ